MTASVTGGHLAVLNTVTKFSYSMTEGQEDACARRWSVWYRSARIRSPLPIRRCLMRSASRPGVNAVMAAVGCPAIKPIFWPNVRGHDAAGLLQGWLAGDPASNPSDMGIGYGPQYPLGATRQSFELLLVEVLSESAISSNLPLRKPCRFPLRGCLEGHMTGRSSGFSPSCIHRCVLV